MYLRKVSFKDYYKIKLLFKRNNLVLLDIKRWKNLWEKNPFLKNKKKWTKGWVIEQNNNIVGHFGSFPTRYILKKKSYICSVLFGWVVDKKFRSHSILLLKRFFMQKDVDFFLGTTTNIKAGKIMNALKAKQIPLKQLNYTYFIFFKLKNVLRFIFKRKNFFLNKLITNFLSIFLSILFYKKINFWKSNFDESKIVKCKKIDNRFDYIWKNLKKTSKNKLLLQRDKKCLKWHLDYFLKKNKAWVFLSLNKKKINGYSICVEQSNHKDSLKRAFLIDLVLFVNKNQTSKNLIGSNIKEAKKRNCDIFEFKFFDKSKISAIKFFKPFKRRLLSNTFYYKPNNRKLKKMLNKEKFWSPTYLDGDSVINF